MSTFEKMRFFYHVAKEGSIKKACAILETSDARVSRYIQDLEQELQQKLFIRRKTGLQLTDYGSTLYASVQTSVANMEKVIQDFSTDVPITRSLKIVTTTGVISILLARACAQFLKNHEDVDIKIYTTNEDVDFATTTVDVGILPRIYDQPGLSQHKLVTLHSRLFASQEYIDKFGMPKNIADLDNHKLLGFYPDLAGHSKVDWHLSMDANSNSYRRAYFCINSAIGQYEAVMEGAGIFAIAKEFPFIKRGKLVPVLPEIDVINFDIYYIVRSDELTSGLSGSFYNFLKEFFHKE